MKNLKKYLYLVFFIAIISCTTTEKNIDNSKYILLNMYIDNLGKTTIIPISSKVLNRQECSKKVQDITKIDIQDWEPNKNPLGNFSAIILKQNGVEVSTLVCFPFEEWKNTDGIISEEVIELADIKKKNATQINKFFKDQDKILEKMANCGLDKFDYYNIPIMYDSPFICDDYTETRKIPVKTIFDILKDEDKNKEYVLVKNIISNKSNNLLTFPDFKKTTESKIFGYSYTRKGCLKELEKEMKYCENEKNKVLKNNICKIRDGNYVLYSCIDRKIVLKNIKDIFSFVAGDNNYRNIYLDSDKLYETYPNTFPKNLNENKIKDYTIFPLE